jgi:hypothetical protein
LKYADLGTIGARLVLGAILGKALKHASKKSNLLDSCIETNTKWTGSV